MSTILPSTRVFIDIHWDKTHRRWVTTFSKGRAKHDEGRAVHDCGGMDVGSVTGRIADVMRRERGLSVL